LECTSNQSEGGVDRHETPLSTNSPSSSDESAAQLIAEIDDICLEVRAPPRKASAEFAGETSARRASHTDGHVEGGRRRAARQPARAVQHLEASTARALERADKHERREAGARAHIADDALQRTVEATMAEIDATSAELERMADDVNRALVVKHDALNAALIGVKEVRCCCFVLLTARVQNDEQSTTATSRSRSRSPPSRGASRRDLSDERAALRERRENAALDDAHKEKGERVYYEYRDDDEQCCVESPRLPRGARLSRALPRRVSTATSW